VHTLRPALAVPGSPTLPARTVRLAALSRMLATPDAHGFAIVRFAATAGDAGAAPSEPAAPRPPATAPAGRICTCGHDGPAHQHYRRGRDCSLCACTRYTGPLARLLPWRH
jgi:hypothetical protein